MNKLTRQLTKQGENVQGDPIYLALERKVPKPILRKIFEKKTSSATWSTNQFCAALKEIVKHENELNAIYANDSDSKSGREERKPTRSSRRRERDSEGTSGKPSREVVFATTTKNEVKKGAGRSVSQKKKIHFANTSRPRGINSRAPNTTRPERKYPPCSFCGGEHSR